MNIDNEYKSVFKLNSKSLLFARVASDAIKDGEYEKALSILETGIEHFDEYPTPFFLLGDLLIKLGNIAEAKIAFKKGNALLNNASTLNYYLNLRPDIIVDSDASVEPELSENPDDLVELADKLQAAKIEIKQENYSKTEDAIQRESEEEFKPLKGLVSETLASIYINQANYKEAKAIYETLIDIHPERELYFMSKLSEIELKITPRKKEDG
jgi:predicted negative regulator of RcsB-dependent stress response